MEFADFLSRYKVELIPLIAEMEALLHEDYSDFYNDMASVFDTYAMQGNDSNVNIDVIFRKIKISILFLLIEKKERETKLFNKAVSTKEMSLICNGVFLEEKNKLDNRILALEKELKVRRRKAKKIKDVREISLVKKERVEEYADPELLRILGDLNREYSSLYSLLHDNVASYKWRASISPLLRFLRPAILCIVGVLVSMGICYFRIDKKLEDTANTSIKQKIIPFFQKCKF